MTSIAASPESKPHSQSGQLWALLIGNLVIGTGILLPAGMLGYIAKDFEIPVASAGWLMTVSGLVVGLGAPLYAAVAGSIDRRALLIGSMLLFAVGHVASVFAPDFATLLVVRALMTVAAGVFTPQAAATVGLLVPPDRRASGIAFVFLGWSLASVAGIPLGSLVAGAFGWRAAFLMLVPVALLVAAWVWVTVPKGLPNAPASFAAWSRMLSNPKLLVLLVVTVASMCGQFLVLTFIQPLLRDEFQASAGIVAAVLVINGAFGLLGNIGASVVVARVGLDRTVHVLLACVLVGMLTIALSGGSLWIFALGLAAWGLGSFSSNSLQQARLVVIDPPMAGVSVALNTSAVYLGQAVGAQVGGQLFGMGQIWPFGATAALFLLAAVILSLIAGRGETS